MKDYMKNVNSITSVKIKPATQKQPSRGVLQKSFPYKFHRIHRKTPVKRSVWLLFDFVLPCKCFKKGKSVYFRRWLVKCIGGIIKMFSFRWCPKYMPSILITVFLPTFRYCSSIIPELIAALCITDTNQEIQL